MIEGISIETGKFATVCRIDSFSESLRMEIRQRLSAICHGPDTAASGSAISSYKETLKEFNKRYAPKPENTKKGMIGELLTHILLMRTNPDLQPANPFFNMEESSIKKGFDLVVFDEKLDCMWVTEVKSGSAGEKGADSFNGSLLNTAKNDLKTRLGNSETHIWLNAINGAKIALSSGKVKDRINQILDECYQEASDSKQDGTSKNVILVSVTYKNTADPVSVKKVKKKRKKIVGEKLFREVMVFSIQKETYEQVAEFLEREAGT